MSQEGSSLLARVDRWESRIRRAVLVAHAGPAIFGLGAVVAGGNSRHLDIVAWALTVTWAFFLLIAGWNRAGSGTRLARWVMIDAVLMAGLAFIGTPARQVVNYITIDGALYGAAFISTRVGLVQLAVVFSGTAVAGLARRLGSDIPSPLQGWVLPVVLPVLGVIAFGFLRLGLDRMQEMVIRREALLDQQRQVAADTARREAVLSGVEAIDRVVGPAVSELSELVRLYASMGRDVPSAHPEIEWLLACRDRAVEDLGGLRQLMEGGSGETLGDAVDTGVLGTSLVQLHRLAVERNVFDQLGTPLTDIVSSSVSGFVREALSNAAKHAPAPYRVKAVRARNGTMRVEVIDGGSGPIPGQADAGRGLGRAALQGYAITVGGRLLERRLDAGYAVALVVTGDGDAGGT